MFDWIALSAGSFQAVQTFREANLITEQKIVHHDILSNEIVHTKHKFYVFAGINFDNFLSKTNKQSMYLSTKTPNQVKTTLWIHDFGKFVAFREDVNSLRNHIITNKEKNNIRFKIKSGNILIWISEML